MHFIISRRGDGYWSLNGNCGGGGGVGGPGGFCFGLLSRHWYCIPRVHVQYTTLSDLNNQFPTYMYALNNHLNVSQAT